jgi:hypothetical protein
MPLFNWFDKMQKPNLAFNPAEMKWINATRSYRFVKNGKAGHDSGMFPGFVVKSASQNESQRKSGKFCNKKVSWLCFLQMFLSDFITIAIILLNNTQTYYKKTEKSRAFCSSYNEQCIMNSI